MNTQTIYKVFNPEPRRFQEIDLNEAELVPGEIITRFFWCNSDQRFVTVPGASLYRVTADLNLELTGE